MVIVLQILENSVGYEAPFSISTYLIVITLQTLDNAVGYEAGFILCALENTVGPEAVFNLCTLLPTYHCTTVYEAGFILAQCTSIHLTAIVLEIPQNTVMYEADFSLDALLST